MTETNNQAEEIERNRLLIKRQLEAGKIVTVLSVWNSIQTFQLCKYISMLKKDGMAITDRWCKSGKKRYKEYWLVTN